MRWRLVPDAGGVTCGNCGEPIAPGCPVALLTQRSLPRCPACAGEPVDDVQVDAHRRELEAERLAVAAALSIQPAPVHRQRRGGFVPASAAAASIFDHKSAAAGDRDDTDTLQEIP